MQTLTITKISLVPIPSANTVCSVWYALGSNPTSWIPIGTNVSVPPNGNLLTALEVKNIADSETFVNVKASANCGSAAYSEQVGGTTTTTTTSTTTSGTTSTTSTTSTTTSGTTTTTTTSGTTTTTTVTSKSVTLRNLTQAPIVVKVKVDGSTTQFSIPVDGVQAVTIASRPNSNITIFETNGLTLKTVDAVMYTSEDPEDIYWTFGLTNTIDFNGTGLNIANVNFIHLNGPDGWEGITVNKTVANDDLEIRVTDKQTGYMVRYYSHAGQLATGFNNVLNPAILYDVAAIVTPSGRPTAPMSIMDSGGVITSCGACTTISVTNRQGNDSLSINIGY